MGDWCHCGKWVAATEPCCPPPPSVHELREVVREAVLCVRSIRCVCDECWTGRERHDPKGCTWKDIEDLREKVEALLARHPSLLVDLPEWAHTTRFASGPHKRSEP